MSKIYTEKEQALDLNEPFDWGKDVEAASKEMVRKMELDVEKDRRVSLIDEETKERKQGHYQAQREYNYRISALACEMQINPTSGDH